MAEERGRTNRTFSTLEEESERGASKLFNQPPVAGGRRKTSELIEVDWVKPAINSGVRSSNFWQGKILV